MIKKIIEKTDARLLFGLYVALNLAVVIVSWQFVKWMVSLG